MDFGLNLCNCLKIVGSGTGSLLASRVHDRLQTFTGSATFDFLTTPIWSLIPTFDFRAGLRYDQAFCSLDLFVEAGYEFITYIKALRLLNVQTNNGTFQFSNADMHGPFVAAHKNLNKSTQI